MKYGSGIQYGTTNPTYIPLEGQDILFGNTVTGDLWHFDNVTSIWSCLSCATTSGNGIYGGSGTVPTNTISTITDIHTWAGDGSSFVPIFNRDITTTTGSAALDYWDVDTRVYETKLNDESTISSIAPEKTFSFVATDAAMKLGSSSFVKLEGSEIEQFAPKSRITGYLEFPVTKTNADVNINADVSSLIVRGHTAPVTVTFSYIVTCPLNYTKEVKIYNVSTTQTVTISTIGQTYQLRNMAGTLSSTYTLPAGAWAILTWNGNSFLVAQN